MRSVFRVLAWTLGGAAALVALAVAVLYVWSERIIRRTYDVPLTTVAVPADSASLAEGERLARVKGCLGGCHGDRLQGEVFFDEPWVARLTAGNLTRAARDYSDADFERAIRHGVRPDGRSLFGMPSEMLFHLTDRDLGAIIAFIRSLPEADGPASRFDARPLGRLGLVLGEYLPSAVEVQALAAYDGPPADTGIGRYVALSTCSECHGPGLEGRMGSPGLSIVGAYTEEAFRRLMRTGVTLDGSEKPLMSDVARSRFAHLTDEEVGALYHYLTTALAGGPVPVTEAGVAR